MANVLVTGANGFVGKKVLTMLLEQGHTPIAVFKDLNRKTEDGLLKEVIKKGAAIQGDITNRDFIRQVISRYEPDYVVHLAAMAIVKHCDSDPWTAYNVNIMGTVALMDAVRDELQRNKRIKKIIYMSTDKAYGNSSPPDGYLENTPFQVSDTYCTSKACGDMIAQSYAMTYGLPVCIVRCANLYGGGDLNLSRLIPGNILRLLKGQQPILYTDAANMQREFLHVSDLMSAYMLLLEKGENGKSYNVGTGKTFKILDVINLIRNKINPNIPVKVVKRDLFEITEQCLQASRLRDLGWQTKVSLDQGLDESIYWYKSWSDRVEFSARGMEE